LSFLDDWPVLLEVSRIVKKIGGIEIWCFGSVIRGACANDIDLLAIYEERQRVVLLRLELEEINVSMAPRFDLICMRPAEERFYGFIALTGAVRIV